MSRMHNPRQGIVAAGLIERYQWADGAIVNAKDGKLAAYLLAQFPELALVITAPWGGGELYAQNLGIASLHAKNAAVIDAPTTAAPALVPDGVLDFAFLASNDGGELAELIDLWLPKIGAWGWLIGADCGWSDVSRILDDKLAAWNKRGAGLWTYPINPAHR